MPETEDLDSAVEAAVAHHRAGRVDEAEQGYRAALAANPSHPRAAHNLGALLLQRGRSGDALEWLGVAVQADPAGPWWETYVKALVREQRFEAAEAFLGARPDPSPALELMLRERWAAALVADKAYDRAEQQLLTAQAAAPENPDIEADLGFVRLLLARPEEAQANLERALELNPDHVAALANLGTVKRRLRRYDEAEVLYRRVLELDPENQGAALNLKTLPGRGERQPVSGAVLALLAASGLDESAEALARLGTNLGVIGHREEALKVLERAVALDPELASARFYRAFARLGEGDFPGGWDDYEIRLKSPAFVGSGLWAELRPRMLFAPTREEVKDRDILLVGEQGIGDMIMFASMIPDLAADARTVACLVDKRLVRLFEASFPGIAFVTREPDGDWTPLAMGSLGRLYRQSVRDFPRRAYLKPRPEVTERWADRLGPRPQGLRIGVSWQGGLKHTQSARRSMPLEQLSPLFDLPGCEFVNLQYGDVTDEVDAINAGLSSPIRIFPKEEIEDFEELAGLVRNLDVVVSVQTSLVHLCGALGQPCLTMVPSIPEWRYGVSGPSMVWYRSVELVRQADPRSWAPVVAEVREILERGLEATR